MATRSRKARSNVEAVEVVEAEAVEVVEEEVVKPILLGIATTNVNGIAKNEMVSIFEDEGDTWLTEKGSVSKLYLLLKKV